jgi:hypothetical protein
MKKTIGGAFAELRASLENNMNHILRDDRINENQAGHYPAAILIVVGSEALSQLRGKRDDHVFVEMMAEHGVENVFARKLFDALRNGLAHLWDTNSLDVGREQVELVVAWKETRHLSLRSSPSPGLNLNVRAMWDDLQKALTKYAAVLGRDASPAPSRETSLTEDQTTLEAWRRFQATAVRKSTDQEGGR